MPQWMIGMTLGVSSLQLPGPPNPRLAPPAPAQNNKVRQSLWPDRGAEAWKNRPLEQQFRLGFCYHSKEFRAPGKATRTSTHGMGLHCSAAHGSHTVRVSRRSGPASPQGRGLTGGPGLP